MKPSGHRENAREATSSAWLDKNACQVDLSLAPGG
jgi:hypothetical protein